MIHTDRYHYNIRLAISIYVEAEASSTDFSGPTKPPRI